MYRFLNASEFFWLLSQYRVCNIRGHYGSGKTLLGVALAYEFWRSGKTDRIYSPFPMAGRSDDYSQQYRCFIILDEAHVILDARSWSKEASQTWLRDLRKRDIVMVLPAVLAVDVRFRAVVVQRVFMLGSLLWSYRWEVDDGAGKHSGVFHLWRPSFLFGAYDTLYSPEFEDFEALQKVMAGTDNRMPPKDGRYVGKDFAGVQEVSYPAPENTPFEKQVKGPPGLAEIWGTRRKS